MKKPLCGVVLVLAGAALFGQEVEPPEFPTLAELVVLDVVVRDDDGQPITNLRPGEIEVLEDGLPGLIESFRLVRAGAAAPAGGESSSVSAEGAPEPAVEKTPSGEAAGAESPVRPNIVILVFDRLGLEAGGAARRAASDFARRAFPQGTWFAVYEIGDSVRVRQRITSDPAALLAAIEQATAGDEQSHAAGTTPDHDTLTKEALSAVLKASADPTGVMGVDPEAAGWIRGGGEPFYDQARARLGRLADSMERQRLGQTALRALLAVSRELAGLEGRKTLLLFSEGLHVPGGLTDVLETLVSEANRSNLSIYGIDPRGLTTEGSFDETRQALVAARNLSEQSTRRRDPQTAAAQDPRTSPETEQSVDPMEVQAHDLAVDSLRMNTQANLRDVAEATGGFLLANTNDLGPGLERIGVDLRSYYEIGYRPAVPFADGRFRNIQVRVSRSGVRVRSRKGYVARPPSEEPTLQPWELALAQAFDLPQPPRDFGHRVATQVVAGSPDRSEVQLALQVPLRALQFDYDQEQRRYRAHFSVLVVLRDPSRRVVTRLSHDWPLGGPLMDAPAVRNQSATVKRTLELEPGEYTLESVVGDRLGGGLSVERTALTVAPTAAAVSP